MDLPRPEVRELSFEMNAPAPGFACGLSPAGNSRALRKQPAGNVLWTSQCNGVLSGTDARQTSCKPTREPEFRFSMSVTVCLRQLHGAPHIEDNFLRYLAVSH